jgi:SAM-dependent methyltransferase
MSVGGLPSPVLELIPEALLALRSALGEPLGLDELQGRRVLDLGCGAGVDCFLAAGQAGEVVGLDRNGELLEKARRAVASVARAAGFPPERIRFVDGVMEELPFESAGFDVVISNNAIHCSAAKERVLSEVWRVLRPGGELAASLLVSDRRWPELEGAADEELRGVAYARDLRRIMARAGFSELRIVEQSPDAERRAALGGPLIEKLVIRAFKLPLEDTAEDYGQVAVYNGTIDGHPSAFALDRDHPFEAGRLWRVSRNTADILRGSRYAKHFSVSPPLEHRGPFEGDGPAAGPAPGGETELEVERPPEVDLSEDGGNGGEGGYSSGGFEPGELLP